MPERCLQLHRRSAFQGAKFETPHRPEELLRIPECVELMGVGATLLQTEGPVAVGHERSPEFFHTVPGPGCARSLSGGSDMKEGLEKLYSHIDDIEIAMMTTRRTDGHLQSRAMATQRRADGADLWFVTLEDTPKLGDLTADPHLNLSYYKDRTREWISVSGIARITRDRGKIHELYATDWQAWFPKGDDPRHGTKDDPRMVLIGVDVHAAAFLEVNKPQPVVLFELVKGWLTGSTPELGEMHHVGPGGA